MRIMGKPRNSSGSCTCYRTKTSMPADGIAKVFNQWRKFNRTMKASLMMLHSTMCDNYLVVIMVLFVALLSFLFPDISQKMQASLELKDMKTVVNKISSEVKKAEVACLTVTDHISYLHCNIRQDAKKISKDEGKLSIGNNHDVRSTKSEPSKNNSEMGFFQRNIIWPTRNTSNKEIAIMSYLYTDSFNKESNIN